MKVPRRLHQFYAWLNGYFWLPCPICGENFGGHEWRGCVALMKSETQGEGVCQKCRPEATRRNLVRFGRDW